MSNQLISIIFAFLCMSAQYGLLLFINHKGTLWLKGIYISFVFSGLSLLGFASNLLGLINNQYISLSWLSLLIGFSIGLWCSYKSTKSCTVRDIAVGGLFLYLTCFLLNCFRPVLVQSNITPFVVIREDKSGKYHIPFTCND